jgi:hypothetical protein
MFYNKRINMKKNKDAYQFKSLSELLFLFDSEFQRFVYILKNEALDELEEEEEDGNNIQCCKDETCEDEACDDEDDIEDDEDEEEEEGECDAAEYALHFLAIRMFIIFQGIVEEIYKKKNNKEEMDMPFEQVMVFLKEQELVKTEDDEKVILILSSLAYESIYSLQSKDNELNFHSNDGKLTIYLPLSILISSVQDLNKISQKIKSKYA